MSSSNKTKNRAVLADKNYVIFRSYVSESDFLKNDATSEKLFISEVHSLDIYLYY